MTIILCIIFFLSGAAALCFEALWFRLSGLTLGNSVAAASTVLAAFMAGLALGNGFAMAQGHKIKRPIRFYAVLEVTIAVSGIALVLVFPRLTGALAPVFRALSNHPLLTSVIRLGVAFVLMLIPTAAMGATLPVLVKALYRQNTNFGQVLGMLYGVNTLGAVVGVLAAELVFVIRFGINGTALTAFAFNICAAGLALCVAKKELSAAPSKRETHLRRLSFRTGSFLAASFASGLILLALEVIWFRFVLLFFSGHTQNFAVMLAAVLAGISLGGISVSAWFKWRPNAHRALFHVLLINGVLVIALYKYLGYVIDATAGTGELFRISMVSIFLMFPVSFMSGMIFTMLGKALHVQIGGEARTTGMLTLANTVGAMAGALLAGLVFIPRLGLERSFFALALGYCGIAVLLFASGHVSGGKVYRAACGIPVVVFIAAALLFPFGLMQRYQNVPCRPFPDEQRVAVREGLTETTQYLRKSLMGKPHYYRLVSNSFVMSDTFLLSKRYMKLFVYLPVAIHPDPKDALLICYGCGSTAKALTDTRSLQNIEIVDTSRDAVELTDIVFPDPAENPLNDPRVKVHIDDGRFFLLTTDRKFDLVTAEPPPPGSRGVVNLYSREYFQLIYNRLSDGGIATYWLPCQFLEVAEAKAITRAFCDVFPEASLWMGAGFNYMLVGVKSPAGPVADEAFARQWRDPVVGPEMRLLGFRSPEQFGSLFIADAERLRRWVGDTPPLVDDFPSRVSHEATRWKSPDRLKPYRDLVAHRASLANFLDSDSMDRIWPDKFRESARDYFGVRDTINDIKLARALKIVSPIMELDACLSDPNLAGYVHWACFSDPYAQAIVAKAMVERPGVTVTEPEVYFHLAARAAQEGKFDLAQDRFRFLTETFGSRLGVEGHYYARVYRMYFLYMQGHRDRAWAVGQEYVRLSRTGAEARQRQVVEVWNWLEHRFAGPRAAK